VVQEQDVLPAMILSPILVILSSGMPINCPGQVQGYRRALSSMDLRPVVVVVVVTHFVNCHCKGDRKIQATEGRLKEQDPAQW